MKDFGDCEKIRKDSKIVITDPGSGNNRSRFRLENPKKLKIRVIQVDDCVIKQGVRCDYLIIAPSNNKSSDSQEIYKVIKTIGEKIEMDTLLPDFSQATFESGQPVDHQYFPLTPEG